MKTTKIALLVVLSVSVGGAGLHAQNQFEGHDMVVTGPNPPFDGWAEVNATPGLQLKNDGTSGDQAAGDGLYSVDWATSDPAKNVGDRIEWKVKRSTTWSESLPPSGNGVVRAQDGNTKYILDTTQRGDGFQPDPNGSTIRGFIYTIPSVYQAGNVVRLVGDMISELGGADWVPDDNAGLMADDGNNGDATAGDGIFTKTFTGVPPGSYIFKVTLNGSWEWQAGYWGYGTNAGDISLNVLASTDNIKIEFDSAKGRTKISNDNVLANPGPPFFACSTAWSLLLDSSTELNDSGSNGDITANDGIYSRIFTATTAGETGVKIRQGQGTDYPASGNVTNGGGYPIITTSGQSVLVQFDTNTVADGYVPASRYVWTDPASRRVPTYVQPVGDFMSEFGGSDWNNNDPLFQLNDGGTNGDYAAADAVWGASMQAFSNTSATWKGLGQQGSWDYQFGGNADGYTRFGDNGAIPVTASGGQSVTFCVDTITGRVASFTNTAATPVTRPASINASATSSVSDWTLY